MRLKRSNTLAFIIFTIIVTLGCSFVSRIFDNIQSTETPTHTRKDTPTHVTEAPSPAFTTTNTYEPTITSTPSSSITPTPVSTKTTTATFSPTSSPIPTSTPWKYVYVIVDAIYIFNAPPPESQRVGEAVQGAAFVLIQKKNINNKIWYIIYGPENGINFKFYDLQSNRLGWVNERYLSFSPPMGFPTATPPGEINIPTLNFVSTQVPDTLTPYSQLPQQTSTPQKELQNERFISKLKSSILAIFSFVLEIIKSPVITVLIGTFVFTLIVRLIGIDDIKKLLFQVIASVLASLIWELIKKILF